MRSLSYSLIICFEILLLLYFSAFFDKFFGRFLLLRAVFAFFTPFFMPAGVKSSEKHSFLISFGRVQSLKIKTGRPTFNASIIGIQKPSSFEGTTNRSRSAKKCCFCVSEILP